MNNPTIIQNKTCDWTGRYIVYYNKREDFKAFVELCEVEVFGKHVFFLFLYSYKCDIYDSDGFVHSFSTF